MPVFSVFKFVILPRREKKKKKEFIYLADDCFYLLKAQLRAAAGFCLPESKDVGNAHFLTSSDDVLVRQKSDKRILQH